MQFKHPEILYALILLVIPIIVHLFQLRKFQKEAFTNVEFLKKVVLQTRKSSQLKKWLTLLTRLLLLAAIIIAFAQPYISESSIDTKSETVVFLDNSFSMEAKGSRGPLFKRSIQEIIESLENGTEITVFTNDNTLTNITSKNAANELLNLDYSTSQLDYNTAILRGSNLFSKNDTSIKNLILVSDFQKGFGKIPKSTNGINLSLVKLEAINNANVSIDTAYISELNTQNKELKVIINNTNKNLETISVSIYNNEELLAKSSISEKNEVVFTLPNGVINAKIVIDDVGLSYDNVLYFNINQTEKVNVLSINESDDNFLKRIYSKNEFNYSNTKLEKLNYNEIENQNLIVLNQLNTIPVSLINSLNQFKNKGGYILIIPSNKASLNSYNQLINSFISYVNSEKKITTINYGHPVLKGVFEKQVSNFQYPKVNSYFTLNSGSNILQFEDKKPFLTQLGNTFLFSSSLNNENSNFTNSPLIVPVLYNIGRQSLNYPALYYNIGTNNTFDVKATLKQDEILKLKSNNIEIIPQQRNFNNKISIYTNDFPDNAGIYSVTNNSNIYKNVSFNYNRKESNLNYMDLSTLEKVNVTNSIPQIMNVIKNDTNVNELWKWFTIFALVLLLVEMLILKYFK